MKCYHSRENIYLCIGTERCINFTSNFLYMYYKRNGSEAEEHGTSVKDQ